MCCDTSFVTLMPSVSFTNQVKLLLSRSQLLKLIFHRLAGLDIKSQDAYELAVQGMLRPGDPHVPMIYGIKCIEFNPPNFTIGKMVYYTNVSNKLNEFKVLYHGIIL